MTLTLTLTHTLPFRRQTVKVEVRTGAIVKRFRNFVAWVEPGPKTAFFAFKVPFDYPAHSLQETVLPQTNGTPVPMETPRLCVKWPNFNISVYILYLLFFLVCFVNTYVLSLLAYRFLSVCLSF